MVFYTNIDIFRRRIKDPKTPLGPKAYIHITQGINGDDATRQWSSGTRVRKYMGKLEADRGDFNSVAYQIHFSLFSSLVLRMSLFWVREVFFSWDIL